MKIISIGRFGSAESAVAAAAERAPAAASSTITIAASGPGFTMCEILTGTHPSPD
ncbi:MAG TPA: hypothetical protein PK280_08305 [Planctomycetota bacterium]|nr:hypothetical protein [Planctomycetota bacterium]